MKSACPPMILLAILTVVLSGCTNTRDVNARLYDAISMCLGPYQPVGNVPEDQNCPPATRYAIDSTGRCFWFSDLCIPQGFAFASESDPRCPSPQTPVPTCR